ncbi:hypothetical protein HMEPL2_19090 [Vreelandella aquamarina]|uniref:Uncharacterized protein n=1 Tax=Vreelandella aquamarina TaxID=77097 RepID=A0A6F8XBT3_9GAMM|nr:hypothetical protein HMEPL2_19090 [Halomonas meridiana]
MSAVVSNIATGGQVRQGDTNVIGIMRTLGFQLATITSNGLIHEGAPVLEWQGVSSSLVIALITPVVGVHQMVIRSGTSAGLAR